MGDDYFSVFNEGERGEIVGVYASLGQFVHVGYLLAEIETSKAILEVTSPDGGTVIGVYHRNGQNIEKGALLFDLRKA